MTTTDKGNFGVEVSRDGQVSNTLVPLPGETVTREQAERDLERIVAQLRSDIERGESQAAPGTVYSVRVVRLGARDRVLKGGHGEPVEITVPTA